MRQDVKRFQSRCPSILAALAWPRGLLPLQSSLRASALPRITSSQPVFFVNLDNQPQDASRQHREARSHYVCIHAFWNTLTVVWPMKSSHTLMVCMAARAFALPLLPPFLQPGASFSRGASFASAGSGALDGTSATGEVPLSRQLQQFAGLRAGRAPNGTGQSLSLLFSCRFSSRAG